MFDRIAADRSASLITFTNGKWDSNPRKLGPMFFPSESGAVIFGKGGAVTPEGQKAISVEKDAWLVPAVTGNEYIKITPVEHDLGRGRKEKTITVSFHLNGRDPPGTEPVVGLQYDWFFDRQGNPPGHVPLDRHILFFPKQRRLVVVDPVSGKLLIKNVR